MIKKCSKCEQNKEADCFSKRMRDGKAGLNSRCKECVKLVNAKWLELNKDRRNSYVREWKKENPESVKSSKTKYYLNNIDKEKEKNAKWRNLNQDRHKELKKQWLENNKERVRKYDNDRFSQDTEFRLRKILRSRLRSSIKNNQKSGSAVRDLGCSIEVLAAHLEAQFLPGMTWDNWSVHGWHIDHIVPLDNFSLENQEEFKKACHYTNLQPLWAKDNLSKGSKILQEVD